MDDSTIATYERIAETYEHKTADYWSRTPQPPFIDRFVRTLHAGERVLDVGSGPGRDSLVFRREGLRPTCLDASNAMITRLVHKGLQAVRGDFSYMPFEDAAFEGVWAYTSLLHVPKDAVHRPLSEIRRVLKPDGVFGLGLLQGTGEGYRDVRNDGNVSWFSYYESDEMRAILERSGFQVSHADAITLGTTTLLHFIAMRAMKP